MGTTTTNDSQNQIAALLSQTGPAHGEYEERELNGAYDQNWADWYAAHLVEHGLEGLLKRSITVEQLSGLLKQYDEAYQRERPDQRWPDYYAQRLIVGK